MGSRAREREASDLSPLVKEHEERRGTNSGHKAAPFLEGLSCCCCCWCSDASSSRRGGGTRGVAVLTEGSRSRRDRGECGEEGWLCNDVPYASGEDREGERERERKKEKEIDEGRQKGERERERKRDVL